MFANQVKCVIWDLDETLWTGSLAEGDTIVPKENIINLVRQLDDKGIINSICSKNIYSDAKRTLEALGIWEYFAFPVIDFVPKGQSVKAIVENLQLRTQNVLFVDDNIGNRNEVIHYCKEIMVADVQDETFYPDMMNLIQQTQGKSRLTQYKIIEKKHQDKQHYADNTSFLKDSDITVCVLRNPTDLIFKQRIFDMANRTNQLNFTKSRFATMEDFEAYLESQSSVYINHGAVFVYDKYGHYGLVGFYAFDERRDKCTLDHFLFSCRIMNMGVEKAVYRHLRTSYGIKPYAPMESAGIVDTSYIRIIHELDDRLKHYINNEMNVPQHYKTLVIAKCNSGIIGHYLPDFMRPTSFDLFSITDEKPLSHSADCVIYALYGDYPNTQWRQMGGFSYTKFQASLSLFVKSCEDKKVFFILSSEKYPTLIPRNIIGFGKKIKAAVAAIVYADHPLRYNKCNSIVRKITKDCSHVTCIESSDFIHNAEEQYDHQHFDRIVFKRICEHISSLVNRHGSAKQGDTRKPWT